MISFGRRRRGIGPRAVGFAVGIGLAAGLAATMDSAAAKRRPRPVPARVVTIRQVIIRREPIVIQAVTLEQLRGELRRARMAQTGYERQITRQYQTIQRLQAQVGLRLREAREADSQRASQLNAQFEVILQAFGLVVFAIIGALLVALCRTDSRAATAPTPALAPRAAIDWDPLQRQIHEAKSALATVETRLRHLEISISQERG